VTAVELLSEKKIQAESLFLKHFCGKKATQLNKILGFKL